MNDVTVAATEERLPRRRCGADTYTGKGGSLTTVMSDCQKDVGAARKPVSVFRTG
ncbi:hypothetical protein [Streptomyces sp. NBC_00316]|uniref:hypothetical protein n=1 Tax=Streptomyces sp. NBC_00316 TaxID=2975710 RepID=UPI002E2804EC|nr:hypothetical protein [Streptomyces sp. NBC_00316]